MAAIPTSIRLAVVLLMPLATTSLHMATSVQQEGPPPSEGPAPEMTFVLDDVDNHEDETFDDFANFDADPADQGVLYNHMPKAGGTFLMRLLRAAVGRKHYDIRTEFQGMSRSDVNHNYVVGSVRNPCNYYLSLWSFGAERGGKMMSSIPKDKRYVYNTTSRNKDSKADIKKFREWVWMVNRPGFPGIMSVRFGRSYGNLNDTVVSAKPPFVLSVADLNAVRRSLSDTSKFMRRVNCWVRTESMDRGAHRCLLKYHNLTKLKVDWDAYRVQFKVGDQFQSSHGSCRDYFTPTLAAAVRRYESPIFKAFNYTKCCA